VDVTGLEPAAPCLQLGGRGKVIKFKSLFELRLAHSSTRTAPANCSKVDPSCVGYFFGVAEYTLRISGERFLFRPFFKGQESAQRLLALLWCRFIVKASQ